VGQLNAFTPHGTAVKAYKKYIFQYITGKLEHMDAIVPQNIRRLFLFDRWGIEDAVVRHGTARETTKNIFFSRSLFRRDIGRQCATWYGGIKRIRKFSQWIIGQIRHTDAIALHAIVMKIHTRNFFQQNTGKVEYMNTLVPYGTEKKIQKGFIDKLLVLWDIQTL
jgi:hypothetical protein